MLVLVSELFFELWAKFQDPEATEGKKLDQAKDLKQTSCKKSSHNQIPPVPSNSILGGLTPVTPLKNKLTPVSGLKSLTPVKGLDSLTPIGGLGSLTPISSGANQKAADNVNITFCVSCAFIVCVLRLATRKNFLDHRLYTTKMSVPQSAIFSLILQPKTKGTNSAEAMGSL